MTLFCHSFVYFPLFTRCHHVQAHLTSNNLLICEQRAILNRSWNQSPFGSALLTSSVFQKHKQKYDRPRAERPGRSREKAQSNHRRASSLSLAELVGCIVLDSNGRAIGVVDEVLDPDTGGLSPSLVRVLNNEPEGVPVDGGLQERHIIPFVPDIFEKVDMKAGVLTINPPKGLLNLGRQELLLDMISPRLLELSGKDGENISLLSSKAKKMPSRAELEAIGEHKLVQTIIAAGGFMYVAQKLGLRTQRKPNGFWEEIDNLDEELSAFIASSWVELKDVDGMKYFYNPISGITQRQRPRQPMRMPLDDDGTFIWLDNEEDRVMPTRSDLTNAGRYDMHNAINLHGGYGRVAEILERRRMWPRNRLTHNRAAIVRELKAAQQLIMEPNKDIMLSERQLLDAGLTDLVRAINNSGGWHRVAKWAGLKTVRTHRDTWKDPETVIRALKLYMAKSESPHSFPTSKQLYEAGRHDLRYALQVHGSRNIAARMGMQCSTRHKKNGTTQNALEKPASSV